MSSSGKKSEMLAAQLPADIQTALLGAVFKSRGWMLQAPAPEVVQMLLSLKLVREVAGNFQVTVAGMGTRAMLVRQAHRKNT